MSKSKTFVLIHGSWHGGWAWQAVIRCLSEKGYGAHAPTLAGHGPGAVRLGVTHQKCGDSVVTYIRQRGLEDVILVGHSFGGSVVQKVAEQVPNRIARIVFLDALILEDNECVLDILPPQFAALVNHLAVASPDNTMLIPWEVWRDNLIQDAPESLARSTWEQLSPEPNQVNLDKLDLKRYYSLAIPNHLLPPGRGNGCLAIFIRECRRASERSIFLRWTGAMRLCLRPLGISRQTHRSKFGLK